MTDKIDTSKLGRIDLASGKSAPVPIEECVSTWDMSAPIADRIQSLIAENERLTTALMHAENAAFDAKPLPGEAWPADLAAFNYGRDCAYAAVLEVTRAALSHKDMS